MTNFHRGPLSPKYLVRGAVLAVLGLLGSPGTTSAQTVHLIDVFNFDFGVNGVAFDPTIQVGDTVRWRWVTGFHSTTSASGQSESWDSGDQFPVFTFDHTFTHVGTFGYFCDIHGFDQGNGTGGGMSGFVIVQQPVPEPPHVLFVVCAVAGLVVAVSRLRHHVSPISVRAGATLIEFLVVVAILGVMLGLFLPAVQRVRESANYTTCRNNLKQIGLATHTHEATFGYFPSPGIEPHQNSVLVPLLPYFELDPLQQRIATDRLLFTAVGDYPRLDPAQAEPARTTVSRFLCPSDGQPAVVDYFGCTLAGTNYVANAGTGTGTYIDFRYPTDGAAWYGSRLRPKDFTDGLSSTMLAAEALRGTGSDSYSVATADPRRQWMSVSCTVWPIPDQPGTNPPLTDATCGMAMLGMVWRGDRGVSWIGGPGDRTLYNTYLMPNDPMSDCGTFGIGRFKASSSHRGGVNMVLADGSVHFIKNHIELDVWRALSTRNDREIIGSYCGCK